MSDKHSMPRLTDLWGLWRRSMIAWPDGRRDTSTRVYWLQGPGIYADLRQPASMPDFAHATSLDDLSAADCARLATQEGFSGRLDFDERHFQWIRQIDFQPASPSADAGSLEWEGQVLVERGRDVDYIEHWHRDAVASTDPCGAVTLRESGPGTSAILLRVGDAFMFARDRPAPLPTNRTLSESVAAATTVAAARALIDCEISFGVVAPEGFRIAASTLPHRRGTVLGQRVLDHTATTEERDAGGAAVRVWNVVAAGGSIGALNRPI